VKKLASRVICLSALSSCIVSCLPRPGADGSDGGESEGEGDVEGEADGEREGDGAENTDALCSDGVSNDGDRFVDCDDFDCKDIVHCSGEGAEDTDALCSDGVSNDGDNFVDCDDFDCSRSPAVTVCGGGGGGGDTDTETEATFDACSNDDDDDGDGHIDGDDFGCCQIVSPSVCPQRCLTHALTLGADGEGDIAAAFSDANPSMWQVDNVSGSLVYSSAFPLSDGTPGYRGRSREFGIEFPVPSLDGSGFEAKLDVSISGPAAANWSVALIDSQLAPEGCALDATAFTLSAPASVSPTFHFTQPGFPYPDIYQPGSIITLLVSQVGDPSELVDAADVHITYSQ
jgi:hypothetical protein